jgi:chromosome segregation ATPase
MKQFFLSAIIFMFFLSFASAQVKTTLKEENRANSKGSFPALVLIIPNTTGDKVRDTWESFVKNYKGKSDYSKKDKEVFTDNATIKEMSDNTIDIYARFDENAEKGTELTVWFDFGAQTYLSQKDYPKQFEIARKMLEKFSDKLSADMLEDLLKEEEKALRKLEDDYKDLEKDEERRKKDIVDYKETIRKMEENIKKAEEDIKTKIEEKSKKKTEIDTQTKKVNDVKTEIKKSQK